MSTDEDQAPSTIFIRRIAAKNFKSIGTCDVTLGPLTYLVGPNGSGKSNFMDILHFVKDALAGSLDQALDVRGGLPEVRRRSGGHPNHFGIRLEFALPDGRAGHYSFSISAKKSGGYEVQQEECRIFNGDAPATFFNLKAGSVSSSEEVFPASTTDRLALVNAAGLPAFRPVFDALTSMGFYNLNPRVMRDLQRPQEGSALKPAGENIASVLAALERHSPNIKALIEEYLSLVIPSVRAVQRIGVGHMETLEFRQTTAGAKHPWRFQANSMSDGTVRALGILVALFQGSGEKRPCLVGIEEPEVALHPAASGVLRDALSRAAQHTQVIVTSHSPDLLDDTSIPVDALLAVSTEDGETYVNAIDDASRTVIREGLYTAGELLKLNQLEPRSKPDATGSETQLKLFDATS